MELFERNGAIDGRITDRETEQPLHGVRVGVEGTNLAARTDIRGRFRISNVPTGECVIRCHLEGYRPYATAALAIAPGRVTRCDCELVPRGTVPLNEPVVLLPLRLEIRKYFPQSRAFVAANVALAYSETFARRDGPLEASPIFEPTTTQKGEYWIRWYPDDIHYLTPIGKISDAERVTWEQFWSVVEQHRELGSVRGLYLQEPYNLSIEVLEIFYGIRPGRLTDAEILRCNAYDEMARHYIETEQQGLREALEWQDMLNPAVKAAWITFTKQCGTVRARQITRDMLEGAWNFDVDNDEDEPLDILVNQGIALPTLPEEISIYVVKDGHIHPVAENLPIDNSNLIAAPTDLEGSRWMTDFDKAVDAGMGVVIGDEDKVKLIDEADWLIVVGLNDSQEARGVLEEIFLRNNANGEIGILAQDSPTNNTDTASTQYAEAAPEAEAYLGRARMHLPQDDIPVKLSHQLESNILDAHRLSYLFGLSERALSQTPESGLAEITEAGAMAALLWTSCTLFYEKLWGAQLRSYAQFGSQPTKFSLGNFFVQNVRARGNYPILRIGENPYGILPVMSMRDWCKNRDRPTSTQDVICRFVSALKSAFLGLTNDVPRIDESADDIYETLLEILRTSPVSKRVNVRAFNSGKPEDMFEDAKYLNCPFVKDGTAGKLAGSGLPFPETAYLAELSHINRPDFDATSLQLDEYSPLLKRLIVYLLRNVFTKAEFGQVFQITGNVFDRSTGNPISEATVSVRGSGLSAQTNEQGEYSISNVPSGAYNIEATHPDYAGHLTINALVQSGQSSALEFHLEPANIGSAGSEDPVPVADSGKTIWGQVLNRASGAALEGVFVHLSGTGKSVLTDSAGEYRFDNLPDGDHKISVGDAGYNVSTFSVNIAPHAADFAVTVLLAPITSGGPAMIVSEAAIPGGLQLIADAAEILKRVKPDKLEILLLETLDLFSHRLDAWVTGLANSQLTDCLREAQKPPPLGVYGWLETPGKQNTASPKPEFIQAPSVKQATTAAILRNAAINNDDEDSAAFHINLSSAQVREGTWYLEGIRQGHLPGELLGYRLERLIFEASGTNGIAETDIYELRRKYPLTLHQDQILTNESTKLTAIDGEKFLEKEIGEKFAGIKARLNQIKDAAADIAICEVVNADSDVARRGGWLDFLDGDGLPPTEDFIRSYRTGDVHGTQVFLQISPPDHLVADESISNPRIIADPILAHFCESLMPDFGSKEIIVDLVRADGTKRPVTFFARELNMHPIDVVIGGLEELRLRIRYYLLAGWKANDPSDLTVSSPYNIFGTFPLHDMPDEPLNDIGIELVAPTNANDPTNILTYIEIADAIRDLLSQNRSADSRSTVSPDQLPLVADQLQQLDLLAGMKLLTNRLNRLKDQLVYLISRTVAATSKLKAHLIVFHGLQDFRQTLLTIRERVQSDEGVDDLFDRLEVKFINLTDSNQILFDLMVDAEIPLQLDQLSANPDITPGSINPILDHLAEIERLFEDHVRASAQALVADEDLPMYEMSQFGLEVALAALPDEPSVTASGTIIKRFDRLIFGLTEKLSSILPDASDLKDYVLCLKTVFTNLAEINQILSQYEDDPATALSQLTGRLPLTEDQAELVLAVKFQNMNYVEPLLDALLNHIDALNENPSHFEDYATVANLILADNQGIIFDILRNSESTAIPTLMNAVNVTENQAKIITSLALEDMDAFEPAGIQERIAARTQKNIDTITSLLQACLDKRRMVILTPYLLSGGQSNWTLDYSRLVHLAGPSHLQEYVPVRPKVSKLFKAFDVASQLSIFEDKRYQRIEPDETDYKTEGNTDYLYLTSSRDPQISAACLTVLLIDKWQEGIPNPEQSEMTGIAIRYESPQAEAPNAVIVAVPPQRNSEEFWSVDLLANTLLETLELMQIRMVGSHEVGESVLVQVLPTLLFSPVDYKPLFPSRDRLLFNGNLGANIGYILVDQLSRTQMSRSQSPFDRNEAPDFGDVYG